MNRNKLVYTTLLLCEIEFFTLVSFMFKDITATIMLFIGVLLFVIPLYFLIISLIWFIVKQIKPVEYIKFIEWTYFICILGHSLPPAIFFMAGAGV